MNRNLASWIAAGALISLTLLTWQLAEGGGSNYALAAVAMVKIALIGAVFLELVRAWPLWTALFLSGNAMVLFGAAWLITG